MINYYIKRGNKVKGPFMLDDLKYQRIDGSTLVREEEDGVWGPVSEHEDLAFLIQIQTNYKSSQHNERRHTVGPKKPGRVPLIISVIIFLAVLSAGLVMFVFMDQ